MNRAIVSLPATMLLDLLKQAAAISGRPFPRDVRFVAADYRLQTEELRLVVESEEYPRTSLGGELMVEFSPFDGRGWQR